MNLGRKEGAIIITFLLSIMFFFFLGETGYVLEKDSQVYINIGQYSGVRPIYPLFVQMHKQLLGDQLYLQAIVYTQGILSMLCSYAFIRYVGQLLRLNIYESCFIYLVSLLTYTINAPANISNHYIITEGITYPLFYIYMLTLIQSMLDQSKKAFVSHIVITQILAMTRPQLQLLWPITGIGIAYVLIHRLIKQQKKGKKILILKSTLTLGISVLTTTIVGISVGNIPVTMYNNYVNDGYVDGQSTYAIWNRLSYTIDESDVELFEEEEQALYMQIYNAIDMTENRYEYRPKNLWTWDHIVLATNRNGVITANAIQTYLEENEVVYDAQNFSKIEVEIKQYMTKILLKEHFIDYLYYTLCLLPQGFICTVFIQKEAFYLLCHLVTLFIYVSALLMALYGFKNRTMNTNVSIIMSITIVVSCCFIVGTNLVYMGLQRYLYYLFGVFHVNYFLMVRELYLSIRRQR